MDDKQVVVEKVIETLKVPKEGLALSTVAWTALYLVVIFVPGISDKNFDFKNRVVSIIHAVLSAILALVLVCLHKPLVIGGPNTPNQILVLNVSSGYFIYDYIACTLNDALSRRFDPMNFFHHAATLMGLLCGLLSTGRSGAELCMCLVLMEVSNPFMHMIQIYKHLGLQDTAIANYNKVVFALVFFVARIILGPPLVYYTIINPDSHVLVKAGALGILLVSLLWFKKIVRMAMGGGSKKPNNNKDK